jgi:Putative transposase
MTVDALEFIRRFLQHVLPTGFPKVRHYGFLSPNSRTSIEAARWLVMLHYWRTYRLVCHAPEEPFTEPRMRCPSCGGPMQVLAFLPWPVALFDTS